MVYIFLFQVKDIILKFIIDNDINNEEKFSNEDFESFKKSVINELIQKPLTLEEESTRDFSYISNRTYSFSLRKDLINYVNNIMTKQDVIDFFNEFIFNKARRLEIALYKSKESNDEKEEKMEVEQKNEKEKDSNENKGDEKKILPSYQNKNIEIIKDIDDFHRHIIYYNNEFY